MKCVILSAPPPKKKNWLFDQGLFHHRIPPYSLVPLYLLSLFLPTTTLCLLFGQIVGTPEMLRCFQKEKNAFLSLKC